MPSQPLSLPKRPHSPSHNSPPQKRRAHTPEEGEVDDTTKRLAQSPSSSRGQTPNDKTSRHAFPFSNRDRRRGGGGDFYRPGNNSPPRRGGGGGYDTYRPDSRHRRPASPYRDDRNGSYDRWQPSASYTNGRGRTRNPYADEPNGNGLRPMDTPGAPAVTERVGNDEYWDRGRERERGKGRVPLANLPPNPPAVVVDQKITDTLNDTIARIEREADEADAKKGGEVREEKESGSSKPRVLRRTADQEMQAYGRKFIGTSQLRDYAISEKLGEGTFGEVHKATHMVSKQVVALKRILMHNEKEGVPVTALREIKILKMLSHPSVVTVCDMVVEAATRDRKGSIYMVFPYMDHDLAGLLENPAVKFSPSQIKLYMRQLLEGTEYLHQNKILHRDLKAANLLINNCGSLQIADFGLARPYSTTNPGWDAKSDSPEFDPLKGGPDRGGGGARYTNCVVTRWYRPPELLMGDARYGCAIDLWGVGCIMGEMWTRRPILCGSSDSDQLERIWDLCGTPDDEIWPGWRDLPGMDGVKPEIRTKLTSRVKSLFSTSTSMDEHGIDLLVKLLTLNPANRITAFEALDHEYFWTEPLPCDPSSLPKYASSHEYDKRKRQEQQPVMQPGYPMPPPQQQQGFRPPGGGGWAGPNGHHHRGRGGFDRGGFDRGGFHRGGGRQHFNPPPPQPTGPTINFSGYVPATQEQTTGFLPPPLGTHSREHRQMRERNMRTGPSRPAPPANKPPPGDAEFLPYG